jgi:L-alanine-DL-glutamate epimerase-like enolase superfamily enzyme
LREGELTMRLQIAQATLHAREPLRSAHGEIRRREVLTVTLEDEQGFPGYGEAAPLESYGDVSLERAREALERYRQVLEPKRAKDLTGVQLIEACRRVDDLPVALAAVEMAMWDRAGRRAGRPVAELLTDEPAGTVPVNATIAAMDRDGAAAQAQRAAAAGYQCIKLKVGIGDDAARVAAVRAAAGPQPALRLDANGAWDVEQAVRMIELLAPAGLELVEEPVHGLRATREVRERVDTRVAIDETAAEPGALGAGVADAVCLKVARCGGISALLAAATLVRTSSAEPYVASSFDGPLGVAAALHAAAALASRGPVPACGLATLGLFEGLEHVLPVREGEITLPQRPGLGVEPYHQG